MPDGQVARVGVGLLALGVDLLVHPLEVLVVHVDLAADFEDLRRAGPSRRPSARRSGIDRIVRALTVMSSPTLPAPARRGEHEHAVLVAQADRRPVDLRLQHVARLLAAEALADALVERADLLLAVRVVDAHHRDGVRTGFSSVCTLAADALRRASRA